MGKARGRRVRAEMRKVRAQPKKPSRIRGLTGEVSILKPLAPPKKRTKGML